MAYKVFNKNWTCHNDFQYKVGKIYMMDEPIRLCRSGFHYCEKLGDCFQYYLFDTDAKVAEVEPLGEIVKSDDDSKCCTNKIRIVREIPLSEAIDILTIGKDERYEVSDKCLINGEPASFQDLKDISKFNLGDIITVSWKEYDWLWRVVDLKNGLCLESVYTNDEAIPFGFTNNYDDSIIKKYLHNRFLNGFHPEFRKLVKDIFLPSLEQMYIKPQIAGEGEAFDYYKQNTIELIKYRVSSHTNAEYYWLRSAYRGSSRHAWSVLLSGYVDYSYTRHSLRCAPVCRI